MTPAELATSLYEHYERRDYDAAITLLHADATLHMVATDERMAGAERIIGFQRVYPEPWGHLRVLRATGTTDAAVEIEIRAEDTTFRCAAFWTVRDGRLDQGVEYWVTVGAVQPDPDLRPEG